MVSDLCLFHTKYEVGPTYLIQKTKDHAAGIHKFDRQLVTVTTFSNYHLMKLTTEIFFLRKLRHMPGIVQFLDNYYIYNTPFLITRYFSPLTLPKLLQINPLSEHQVRIVLQQLIHTLRTMREKKVVHLRVTPNAILIHPKTLAIQLTDFEYAATHNVAISQAEIGHLAAPPEYFFSVLPEKWHDSTYVWNCGILTTVMLTCQTPFKSSTDIVEKSPPTLEQQSKNCQLFVGSLLEKNIAQRCKFELILHHPFMIT
jgi:serine/threonine protein kinase